MVERPGGIASAVAWTVRAGSLLSENLCDDEDHHRAKKSAAQQEINNGKTDRGDRRQDDKKCIHDQEGWMWNERDVKSRLVVAAE